MRITYAGETADGPDQATPTNPGIAVLCTSVGGRLHFSGLGSTYEPKTSCKIVCQSIAEPGFPSTCCRCTPTVDPVLTDPEGSPGSSSSRSSNNGSKFKGCRLTAALSVLLFAVFLPRPLLADCLNLLISAMNMSSAERGAVFAWSFPAEAQMSPQLPEGDEVLAPQVPPTTTAALLPMVDSSPAASSGGAATKQSVLCNSTPTPLVLPGGWLSPATPSSAEAHGKRSAEPPA
mmetsp:Transcript_54918/g.159494  ORF Transcript_54918/g.159494 Transcript_54918/m.159494 type:complete len:233 (-) Transcript_54918:362-1060(-)